MLFSIVTPVMNGMPWLKEAIASVDKQRHLVKVEHIIWDGGSTDGTREWLLAQDLVDTQILLQNDRGQSDALRRAFEHTRADILGWLNADDLLEDGALATVGAHFLKDPELVLVGGSCRLIDEEGRLIGSSNPLPEASTEGLLAELQNLPQPSTFFRREAYLKCGGIDPGLHYAMDVDLWMKLSRLGPMHLVEGETFSRVRLQPMAKKVLEPDQTAKEDWYVRMRHGMNPFSKASFSLARRGFIYPHLRPFYRIFKKIRAMRP